MALNYREFVNQHLKYNELLIKPPENLSNEEKSFMKKFNEISIEYLKVNFGLTEEEAIQRCSESDELTKELYE